MAGGKEGYNGANGWAINGKQFDNQADQDDHDAEAILLPARRVRSYPSIMIVILTMYREGGLR